MAQKIKTDIDLRREYHTWLRLERGYSPNTVEGYEMDLDKLRSYAEEHGLDYINFLPLQEEIGLDFTTDTYDAGLHLNIYGAEKASAYFAHILSETYGLEDHRGDSAIAADWEGKCAQYDALLAAQLQELEEYGYLKSWTLGNDRP